MNAKRKGRRLNEQHRALKNAEAFARYAERYPGSEPRADAEQIAGAIARKHCAGRRGRVSGAAVLEALRAGPDPACDASNAVDWMLGSISIPECMKLVVLCGVRYEELARALRARAQQREALVRYLNQFAIQNTPTQPTQCEASPPARDDPAHMDGTTAHSS